MVHSMVNTKYLAKEPVKKARGQNSLPKTDEVEGERYALEIHIALYGPYYLFCRFFRVEYGENL